MVALPVFGRVFTVTPPNPLFEAITNNFAAWDTNHDLTLSDAEVNAAIENSAFKGPAAAALATLRVAMANRHPPVTFARAKKLASQRGARYVYAKSLECIEKVTHRELFVSSLPQLETIHQGHMGDCFTLAPLGAMVYRDPHEVAAWFEVQSNGNYLVKMAAGAVLVPPPTDAELAFASANNADGIWIELCEKAIAEARNERKPPGKRFDLALDSIAKGGNDEPILSYITGHKVAVFPLSSERAGQTSEVRLAELRAQIAFASSNRLLITADTVRPSTPGLMPTHAYALLEYNSASDTLKIWNPHGNNFKPRGRSGLSHGYITTNGIFNMPLADFANQFEQVTFERPETTSLKWTDQWELLAEAGRFAEAATDLSEVIDSNESENWKFYMLTPLLIQAGRLAEYTNHCRFMLDQFEQTSDPPIAERTAKSCLLLPSILNQEDFARVTNLATRCVSLSERGQWLHWRLMTRGLAEYRAGRYPEAIQTEVLALKAPDREYDLNGPACEADAYFITAMAYRQLKQEQNAQSNLKHALQIVEKKLPKLDNGDLGNRWFDTLMSNILMKEARQSVEGAPAVAEKS